MKKQALYAAVLAGLVLFAIGIRVALREHRSPPVKVQESVEPPRPSPIDDVLPRPPLQVVDERNSVRARAATPSKVVEAKGSSEPAQDMPGTNWAVVAAIYKQYEAAEQRARKFDGFSATVFPSKGEGSKYMVLLGSGLSYANARSLRDKATAAGLPPDTYVTKLSAAEKR
jgi:cell division protein FtsN